MIIVLTVAGFVGSAILTYLMRLYSIKYNVIDVPVARSSHDTPTPRGGGMAIVVSLLVVVGGGWNLGIIEAQLALLLLLPGSLVALIGFWDDHQSIRSIYRILVHATAALWALWLLPEVPTIPLLVGEITQSMILFPVYTLGLVWLLNLYNFMDGIDGIAGAEAISVLTCALCILSLGDDSSNAPTLFLIVAVVLGFLIWNWSPARIFMGDGGSGFLGFILGAVALFTSAETNLNIWCWFILLGVFICDASWTLITRFCSGQDWHQPHRSHAYQILARRTSHARVSAGVLAINLFWLAPLAGFASIKPTLGLPLAMLAYLPLLVISYKLKAGLPDAEIGQ